MVRIFDVENGRIKINEHCLLIPELKAVMDTYKKDPVPPLSFVYYMSSYDSPYINLPEGEKEDSILNDVGGKFSSDDEVLHIAIDKMKKLFETPLSRLLDGAKKSMDNVSTYLATAKVEGGLKGNMGDITRLQMGLVKIAENYKKVEKMRDEEIKTALRGGGQMGMY